MCSHNSMAVLNTSKQFKPVSLIRDSGVEEDSSSIGKPIVPLKNELTFNPLVRTIPLSSKILLKLMYPIILIFWEYLNPSFHLLLSKFRQISHNQFWIFHNAAASISVIYYFISRKVTSIQRRNAWTSNTLPFVLSTNNFAYSSYHKDAIFGIPSLFYKVKRKLFF